MPVRLPFFERRWPLRDFRNVFRKYILHHVFIVYALLMNMSALILHSRNLTRINLLGVNSTLIIEAFKICVHELGGLRVLLQLLKQSLFVNFIH